MKPLVVYYSRTGTTKKLGLAIASKLGCESEEIIDLKPRKGIIGWIRSGRDAFKRLRTDIKKPKIGLSGYDMLIIGTPVWAGYIAPAVRTYLEDNKEKIKQVAFFTTQGSADPQKAMDDLAKASLKKPKAVLRMTTKEVLRDKERLKKAVDDYVKKLA
jgi:flavodoxin